MGNNLLEIEERIVKALRTVYDPEIPVNIYDLGLVYDIDVNHETGHVVVTMTLTSPNCPVVDFLITDAQMRVESVEGVKSVEIKLTFEPEWHRDMMSEEAKLELGLL
ncbi:MAG: iron-sulfur cluster assembly protein [Porphyromonas sp.]|nr:iron-sulfur cluster assembly protein [Porphyromonas sp.]